MPFAYVKDLDSPRPKMLIDKHIGMDAEMGMGIDGSVFTTEMLALQAMGKKGVDVWINTPGGSVLEGFKIYSSILHSQMDVDTYCMGISASMGAFIFMAGKKRHMVDFGKLMFHGTRGSDDAVFSKEMTDSCTKMVAARCGRSTEEIAGIMTKKDTWMGAEEAFVFGLANKILLSSEANKAKMKSIPSDESAMYREAAVLMGQMLKEKSNTPKIHKMEDVTVKDLKPLYDEVGLIEGMQVTKITDAVKDLKAKLETANKIAKTEQDKANTLATEKATLEQELALLNAKISVSEKAAAEELLKAKRESAKAALGKYAEQGKIKGDEETINKWLETSDKIGMEEVASIIDALPLNKEGANLKTKTVEKDANGNVVPETNAASKMGELMAKLNTKQS
jgi:ATP-dependent Clp protease protease subunit